MCLAKSFHLDLGTQDGVTQAKAQTAPYHSFPECCTIFFMQTALWGCFTHLLVMVLTVFPVSYQLLAP
jgi:hypothetical protein